MSDVENLASQSGQTEFVDSHFSQQHNENFFLVGRDRAIDWCHADCLKFKVKEMLNNT